MKTAIHRHEHHHFRDEEDRALKFVSMNNQFVPPAGPVKRESRPNSKSNEQSPTKAERERSADGDLDSIHSYEKDVVSPRQQSVEKSTDELLPLVRKIQSQPIVISPVDSLQSSIDSDQKENADPVEEILSKKSLDTIEMFKRRSLSQSWRSASVNSSASLNNTASSLNSYTSPRNLRESKIAERINRFRSELSSIEEKYSPQKARHSSQKQKEDPPMFLPSPEPSPKTKENDTPHDIESPKSTEDTTDNLLEDTQEILRDIRSNFFKAMNYPADRDVVYDSLDGEVKQIQTKADFALNLINDEIPTNEEDDQDVLNIIRARLSADEAEVENMKTEKKSWDKDINEINRRYTDSPDIASSYRQPDSPMAISMNVKLFSHDEDDIGTDVEPLVKKAKSYDEKVIEEIKEKVSPPKRQPITRLINDIIEENISHINNEKKLELPVQFVVEKNNKRTPRSKYKLTEQEKHELFANDPVCQTLEKKINDIKKRLSELT
jgi:hypothetical protein